MTIKSKTFSQCTWEMAKRINGKTSLSLEDKKNIIINIIIAMNEMFVNLDISNLITLPENKSQIPHDYIKNVLSLLITENASETLEEQKFGGEDSENEENQEDEEKTELIGEEIKKQYMASWKRFISANYKQIIQQLLLSFSKADLSTIPILKQIVKDVFTSEIANEKQFQEYINDLHKEAEKVFEAFAKEDTDKLIGLRTEVLPKVNSSLKPEINTLFSAVFYQGFHEIIIAVVPEADREFIPPILSEDFFFEFSSEINIKFSKLLDDKSREHYLNDKEGLFPSGLTAFSQKPAENRLKKHANLYEIPPNEFQATQLKDIELIYQGAKKTFLNESLHRTDVKKLDCANLLLVMIWNKDYGERAVNDGIFDHIFKLEGDVNTEVLPFIVEMAIGNQIPLEKRIEIVLKAALLRAGSVNVLLSDDTILALKPYLCENPTIFKKIYQDLFIVKELSNEEIKTTNDFTVTLKSGHGNNNLFYSLS